MKLQVLISTMHREDHGLIEQMNVNSDVIVINQCDRNDFEEFTYKGNKIKWYSLAERGVGLSRNTALMRGDAEILLFADDDVVYSDDYKEKVIRAFEEHPEASLIVFNLISENPNRPEAIDDRFHKLYWFNCLKYGAFRIAVRKDDIIKNNIYYSLLFGGGAPYQAGEDNLFITNCIQKGLVCYASNEVIGTVKQEESTWFQGYNAKYYHDRGVLFASMYGKLAKFILLMFELKNIRRKKDLSFKNILINEFKGVEDFKIKR